MSFFKYAVLITALTSIAFSQIRAQENYNQISGKVINTQNNSPVEFATVVLNRNKDSEIVKSEFTDIDGQFLFDQLEKDTYSITVLMLGFNDFSQDQIVVDGQKVIEPLTIKLSTADQLLKEVEVVYKKRFVERKIDKTVLNVDALISNEGLSALEVIRKSPGVSLTANGNVKLRGKLGVQVFIDDKPTNLSGDALESYLDGLPASSLSSIELMTNPSAKYDAAGNGIINIKTKKSKLDGFNGSLSLAPRRSRYNQFNGNLNLNFKKNKFNYFGSLSTGIRKRFHDIEIYRDFKNQDETTQSITDLNTDNVGSGILWRTRAGVDYYHSSKSTWGFLFTGLKWDGIEEDESIGQLLDAERNLDSLVNGKTRTTIKLDNYSFNLSYQFKFDNKKQSLRFDADYVEYQSEDNQRYDNAISFPMRSDTIEDILAGISDSEINIYSTKVDYSNKIHENVKLLLGAKTSYAKTDNIGDYNYTIDNVTTPDYEISNHFIYEEMISSAFVNLNVKKNRLSIQSGLRFENTVSKGLQLGNEIKPRMNFDRNYRNLFPTFYLNYALDTLSNHVVGFNYGKRIERPYYRDLNPITTQIDKFTFNQGNPYLLAALTHNVELFYSFKNKTTTTLSYSNTDNQVNETVEIINRIYYNRPGNIGKTILKSISVDAAFSISKWLRLNAYAELTNIHATTDFYTGTLDVRGTYFDFRPNFQFQFPKNWSAELNVIYISKVYEAQFINDPYWYTNIGFKKKLAPRSSLSLLLTDVFHTFIRSGVINNLDSTEATFRRVRDTRRLTLTFNYRFGNLKSRSRRSYRTSADSEKRRVN